jgi:hypothetical protein
MGAAVVRNSDQANQLIDLMDKAARRGLKEPKRLRPFGAKPVAEEEKRPKPRRQKRKPGFKPGLNQKPSICLGGKH